MVHGGTEGQIAKLTAEIRWLWLRIFGRWSLLLGAAWGLFTIGLLWLVPGYLTAHLWRPLVPTTAGIALAAALEASERRAVARLRARIGTLTPGDQVAVLAPLKRTVNPVTRRIADALGQEPARTGQAVTPSSTPTARGDEAAPVAESQG